MITEQKRRRNKEYKERWSHPGIKMASLDHAMWFHAPMKFDDWHLYSMDAPYAGGGRSFNRGKVFDQQGRLIASVAQEGLMRKAIRKPKPT